MGSEPWKAVFLSELAASYSITHASDAAGVARSTAYEHRDRDEEFRAAWDEAVTRIDDKLEQSAMSRAIDGWDEPVFYRGEQCGLVRKFDNGLTWNLLRRRRKAMYGDDATGTDAQGMAAMIRAFIAAGREMNAAEGEIAGNS